MLTQAFQVTTLTFKCLRHYCEKLENGSVQQKSQPSPWNQSLSLSLSVSFLAGTAMETFNVWQHNSSLLYKPSDWEANWQSKNDSISYWTVWFELLAIISFCLELFAWNSQTDLIKVADKIQILNCLVGPSFPLPLAKCRTERRWPEMPMLQLLPPLPSWWCPPHSFQCPGFWALGLIFPYNVLEGKRIILVIYIVEEVKKMLYSFWFKIWGYAN